MTKRRARKAKAAGRPARRPVSKPRRKPTPHFLRLPSKIPAALPPLSTKPAPAKPPAAPLSAAPLAKPPAPPPAARAEVKIVKGIPRAPEPFPQDFFAELRSDLEGFWRRLELIFKAGEPPRRLPPEKILE
ncbi:MAG: hypothetical protein QXH27_04030 [Candidatus Micrarchaeia archaeon]